MYDDYNPERNSLAAVAAAVLVIIFGLLTYYYFSGKAEDQPDAPIGGSDNYDVVIRTDRYTVEVVRDKPRGVSCWILDYTGGGSISCIPDDQTVTFEDFMREFREGGGSR